MQLIRASCPTVYRDVLWSGLVTHIHSQPHGNSSRRPLFLALERAVVWVCGATIWNFIIRKSGLLERRVGHTGLWSRNCGVRVEWRTERGPILMHFWGVLYDSDPNQTPIPKAQHTHT